MKFLYATDTHLKGRNPSSRTDNFQMAMLRKLEELCYVAKRIGAQAILHGGDLFDVPDVSNNLIGEVARIIRQYGVPFYVVPGNHDLFGYSLRSLPQTALGLLAKAGVIELMTRDDDAFIFDDGTVKVAIQGQEYYNDIDKGDPQDYMFPGYVKADHRILIPHSMLLDKPFHPDIPHTLTKDVNTLADLVLVGHYHNGFADHHIGTTRYFNPGSMGRLDATKSSISRIPGYVIIDAQANQHLDILFKEFKTAKPGAEVLDGSHLASKGQRTRQLEMFRSTISQVQQYDDQDIQSILIRLAGEQNIDISVIKYAKDMIVAAEQADKATTDTSGFIEAPGRVHLAGVDLVNFQSHPDTSVDFDGGLNAILGPSDSGKTAILRGIRLAVYNEPKGTDFIRTGENEASVRLRYSNGKFIRRSRTRKNAGQFVVGDLVLDPSGVLIETNPTVFEGFGNDIPVDIQNIAQMPKSNLGRGDAETLNFSYQLNAPFMISEGGAQKASMIGRLTGVHLVDTAIQAAGVELLRTTKAKNILDKEIETLVNELKAYDTVDAEGQLVDTISKRMDVLQLGLDMIDDLNKIWNTIDASKQVIIEAEKDLSPYDHIDLAKARMDKLDAAMGIFTDLQRLTGVITKESNLITSLTEDITKIGDLSAVSAKMERLDKAVVIFNDLHALSRTIKTERQSVEGYNKALAALPDVTKLTKALDDYEALDTNYDSMLAIRIAIQHEDKKIAEFERQIEEEEDKVRLAQAQLDEVLDSIDVCPLCERAMEAHIHA